MIFQKITTEELHQNLVRFNGIMDHFSRLNLPLGDQSALDEESDKDMGFMGYPAGLFGECFKLLSGDFAIQRGSIGELQGDKYIEAGLFTFQGYNPGEVMARLFYLFEPTSINFSDMDFTNLFDIMSADQRVVCTARLGHMMPLINFYVLKEVMDVQTPILDRYRVNRHSTYEGIYVEDKTIRLYAKTLFRALTTQWVVYQGNDTLY